MNPDATAVETTDVVPRDEGDEQVSSLVRLAIQKDVDVEVLMKLVGLQEWVTERNARAAFFHALTSFQEECPEIPKVKTAEVDTRKGASYSYSYAPLEEITRTIRPILHRHGLSFSFDAESGGENVLNVICVLRHIDGHEERARFPVPTETHAPMTAAQKNGAALTYGRRQSLVAVLGLTTADQDTDAQDPTLLEPIDEKQVADIEALLAEVGADKEKFLAWLGVGAIHEIRMKDYERAIRALMQKRNQS